MQMTVDKNQEQSRPESSALEVTHIYIEDLEESVQE